MRGLNVPSNIDAGEQVGDHPFGELDPRLHPSDHLGTEVGAGKAACDQLGDDSDVSGLEVLAVQAGGGLDLLVDVGGLADRVAVAAHAVGAGLVQGGQQQIVEGAEVVEDQAPG